MPDSRFLDAAFLGEATGGEILGWPEGSRVITDSREAVTDAVFVALTGPNFDGHAFVEEVLARGATGAVVSRAWVERHPSSGSLPLVVVEDTLLALQALARAHRRRHAPAVAAITGSAGKTTTKELLAAALAPLGAVHKTRGNRNNQIGVPLTLLEIDAHHRAAVIEMGLNMPGEMLVLSDLALPRVALITNIGEAHLERLGSRRGVAMAKAEIASGLAPGGVLVTPYGDPDLEAALRGTSVRRVTFGLDSGADFHPRSAGPLGDGCWRLEFADGVIADTPAPGRHMALNLLAALAVAREMGVPVSEAAAAASRAVTVPGRLTRREASGVTILDDTYNANPASLGAALDVLRESRVSGKRYAVLGDMLELGPEGPAIHHRCGGDAVFLDGLVTVGTLAAEMGRGAVEKGLSPEAYHHVPEGGDGAAWLLSRLAPGDVVLVKGSRGVRLETTVASLIEALGGEG